MKKIVLKAVSVVIVLILGACNKFLETQPTEFFAPSTYYQTEEHLDFALAGVYDMLGSTKLYGAELHSRHNMEADEGFWNSSALVTGRSVHNFTANDPDIRLFWKYLYLGVGRANTLLANVDNNPDIDEKYRDRVRGEALFLRAYYYFLLVQSFENVPLYLSPITNHEQVDVPGVSAKEVYEQIIADMETAEKLVMPIEELKYGGRVSKSAVRGVLARVCLNMAGYPVRDVTKYEQASYWAKKVIDDASANHQLNEDYTDIFIKYARDEYDIKESIWEVEFWGTGAEGFQETGYVGSWIGIRNSYENGIGYSFGRILATGKHYRTYEAGDLRRDWNIAPFAYTSTGSKTPYPANPQPSRLYERNAGKYRREYQVLTPKSGQQTPINFPLLRYADVLLMYAEAENEIHNGPTTEALEAINLVRRRGFGDLKEGATNVGANDILSGMSKFQFFQAVVDERSRELCYEALRRPDLIRWGIFVETMKETLAQVNADLGSTAWQGLTFKNASAKYVIYPIPSYELELNKALEQHPLWK